MILTLAFSSWNQPLLMMIATLATLSPTVRIARIQPAQVLRSE